MLPSIVVSYEQMKRAAVLPLYANTHTESSGTGLQTTRFREEARQIIKDCCNADEDYALVFAGSGSTGAIARLVTVLNLRIPAELDAEYGLSNLIPAEERPVVFVGPFEHHSNELPWRESIADVVTIPEDADGHIDLEILEKQLVAHADRPLRIGSFSAASNVTGISASASSASRSSRVPLPFASGARYRCTVNSGQVSRISPSNQPPASVRRIRLSTASIWARSLSETG